MLRKFSIALYEKIYRENIWSKKPFLLSIVENYMQVKSRRGTVLDAACGFDNAFIKHLNLKNTIGIDIDSSVKIKNKLHNKFIIADLHTKIDICNVDRIISLYTWEHLHSPELVLKNFYELLNKDGVLIIIAPQRYGYISIIERLLPNYLKNLAWKILKGKDKMPYPAFFELCSKDSLMSASEKLGFEMVEYITFEQPPIWFLRIPPLFILACLWMSIVNKYTIFSNIRSGFLTVLRKP